MYKSVLLVTLVLPCAVLADRHTAAPDCQKDRDCDQQNIRPKGLTQLKNLSITANRMNTDISRYAGQISVLGPEQLQASDNVIESLSSVPGFETGDDFGRSIGSYFNIRGFGYQSEQRVIIEQDGVKRSASLFSNHISTFRADNDLLKRVEVVKGGSSVLHGSGAIGGIVSMRTRDARDFINPGNHYGVTVGTRRETNALKSGRLALAFDPTSSPFDLLVYGKRSLLGDTTLSNGGYMDDDGQRIKKVFNDEAINTSFIKGGWDITDEQRLSLSAYQYKENLTTTWQTLWHRDPGTLPVIGELRQNDYVADYRYQPEDNPLVDLSIKLHKSRAQYHRTRDGVNRGRPIHIDYVNRDERWGANIKNQADFTTGSVTHQLVTGFEYDHREEDAVFVYNAQLSDFGSFPNFYDDYGLYAQDIMSINRLELTLGARYDHFRRGVDLPDREAYSKGHLSPKIAAAFTVLPGVALLAGYSETFRGPTPNETSANGPLNPHYWYLPNLDLQPEAAREFEVGFSIDKDNLLVAGDNLYLKLTHFDGKIEDMIRLTTLPPEFGSPPNDDGYDRDYARYANADNARRRGTELEARYELDNWFFKTGYDHLKLYDDERDRRLDVFADKLSLQASYLYRPWGLKTGLQARHWFRPHRDEYSFTRRGDTYNYINRAFTLVDLKGEWKPTHTAHAFLNEGFSVQFGINNLFDKHYIQAANTESTSAVGKGRNVYLELVKTF